MKILAYLFLFLILIIPIYGLIMIIKDIFIGLKNRKGLDK